MNSTAEKNNRTRRVDTFSITSFSSPIIMWAMLGLLAAVFSFSVLGQWLFSATEFVATPVGAADVMQQGGVLKIRVLEIISTCIALFALYAFLIRPWLQTRRAPIVGLTLIGALVSYVLDTTVNFNGYFMAWNVHSINWGTWASFFPGHTGPTRYAEALFWGPPMYLYFGVLFGLIQLKVIQIAQKHGLALIPALLAAFAVAFALDLVGEWSIIYFTEAYAWANTASWLTLLPGSQFQFPLYESLAVAIYASLYALLIKSSRENPVSFIERGIDRLPHLLQFPARLLAAIGFATVTTAIYFVTFYWFSQFADSAAALPHYLMYAP